MNEKINYQKKLDQLLAALEKEWQGAGESQGAGEPQVAEKTSETRSSQLGQARKAGQFDQTGQSDLIGKSGQSDQLGQARKADQSDQTGQSDLSGKFDQSDLIGKADQFDQSGLSGKSDQFDQFDQTGKSDQSDLTGQFSKAEKSNIFTKAAKPSLLLHACCGPCSSYVLEYLAKYFQITVLYYNPNIYPQAEYERRLAELKKLYQRFPPVLEEGVKLVECEYQPEQFYDAIGVREEPELAHEKEKGERCRRCYEFRLERAADYAAENNFDYFCTTLSISPFKDAVKINEVGVEIEEEIFGQLQKSREGSGAGVGLGAGAENKAGTAAGGSCEPVNQKSPKWLFSDFKKKGGFKRSLELSEEYGMYRQTYCGCVYSMNSRCCPSE